MFTAPTAFRSVKKEDPHLRAIRPREISDAVPRRRARRPRHPGLGGEVIEETGDRPLVADRDRVGDYRQSGRPRAIRRWRCPATTYGWSTRAARQCGEHARIHCGQIAIGTCVSADAMAAGRLFRAKYLDEFPGYYKTADAGFKDEEGYIYVMSRTDDIINVAGHRLSTGGMEEVLASHPDV